MSKGLEELNNPFAISIPVSDLFMEYTYTSEQRDTIEKSLKAIDVIKDICNLKVYKNKLGQCFLEGTNILFPISQETYDLLKEVLL